MNRRKFLTSSLATSAVALASSAAAQTPAPSAREFYHIRRYILESGPQSKLTEGYFADALIPTLTRMGMGPVGAFRLELGQDTPMLYLLIPGNSITALAELDLNLAKDEEFLKAASPFWNATAAAPPFIHVETSLTLAFEGWPKLVTPPSTATKSKRIFQLRTYMSPSNGDHVRKVEMFHSGEFEIFKRTGCNPVFFSDVLFGPQMPCLTYMLSFENTAELDARWILFRNDPDWKKLTSNPRFTFDTIVTNVTNITLSPLASSQI